MKDPAKKYFGKLTDRERAIFEGGITLGAIYHQFIGSPIHEPRKLELAIEQAALAQPFIEQARVRISSPKRKGKKPYEYLELEGEMLNIELVAKYGDARVRLGLRYVPELKFPLMYVR